jgi:hypothetical protein
VGVQDKWGTVRAGSYSFFNGKRNENINWGKGFCKSQWYQ